MSHGKRRQARPGRSAPTDRREEVLARSAPRRYTHVTLAVLTLLVVAATFGVHRPVLLAGALSIDDHQFLTDNHLVQNPSWASAGRFFAEVFEPSTVEGYYVPLTMVSLMLDCGRGGRPDNLRPFHETALVLHALNAALVVVLLYLLLGHVWPAALVGLLFGLHPLTVEPVAWIGERKTLLACFCALGCLVLYAGYVRRASRGFLVAAVIAYVLALLAKPTATPLPVVLLLLDYWPLHRLNLRALIEKVPFLVVGAASTAITLVSHSRTAGMVPETYGGPLGAVLLVCHNLVFYLRKIVWPADLTCVYLLPEPLSLAQPVVIASVIVAVVLSVVVVLSLRRTRSLTVGTLVFIVMLAPTLGLVGYSWVVVSDKYAYLPSIGLLLFLAAALCKWWRAGLPSSGVVRRGGAVALVLVLATAESVATRRYLACWNETVTLFERVVRLTPGSAPARNHLGHAYAQRGDHGLAVDQFRRALECYPTYADARYNLGRALERLGQPDEALAAYRRVLEIDPEYARAYNNIGNLYANRGRLDEAAAYFRRAVDLAPEHAQAHYNLGCVLAARGDADEAIDALRRALRFDPNNASAHLNLGSLLRSRGDTDGAIRHFRRALDARPDFSKAYNNLANALADAGRFDEAVAAYVRAFETAPDRRKPWENLAALLSDASVADGLVTRHVDRARRNPRDAEAQRDLAVLLVATGKDAAACPLLVQAAGLDPDRAKLAASIAWLLATIPSAEPAQREAAVSLARRAARATEYSDARILDVLAVACAATGRFDEAVTTARAALRQAESEHDPAFLNGVRARLELFEAGRSYRVQPGSVRP